MVAVESVKPWWFFWSRWKLFRKNERLLAMDAWRDGVKFLFAVKDLIETRIYRGQCRRENSPVNARRRGEDNEQRRTAAEAGKYRLPPIVIIIFFNHVGRYHWR